MTKAHLQSVDNVTKSVDDDWWRSVAVMQLGMVSGLDGSDAPTTSIYRARICWAP